eukprot:180057-Pyramimonas_sp.AAC.1
MAAPVPELRAQTSDLVAPVRASIIKASACMHVDQYNVRSLGYYAKSSDETPQAAMRTTTIRRQFAVQGVHVVGFTRGSDPPGSQMGGP